MREILVHLNIVINDKFVTNYKYLLKYLLIV